MLIGISGKIGSGKDTVGKIIQYLSLKYKGIINPKQSFGDYLSNSHRSISEWEIKKFAGKLKEIVSLLTSIPVQDLELQEVKDKKLGDHWMHGNGVYTVRELLQKIGTEAMRNVIHPNIWVNALFADYKRPSLGEDIYKGERYTVKGDLPKWIITDVRFENEAKAVLEFGGILIRVNRNFTVDEKTKEHPSETGLDNFDKFDYIIDNNQDINVLVKTIEGIMIKEGII